MALPVHERNTDALEQARQEDVNRASAANGPFVLNPKPGLTSFRVMPAWDERGLWYYEVQEHNFLNGSPQPFLCIAETQGRCPICEHGEALAAQGDSKGAKAFQAATKFFLNVIVFSDSSGKNTIKNGIQIMRVGVMIKKALLTYDLDVIGGYGDITAYETGFDINMDKSGTGLLTKYDVKVFPQRRDVLAKLVESGTDPQSLSLHALDQVLPEMSFDELSAAFEAVMNNAPKPSAQPTPVAVAPVAVATKPGPAKPGQTASATAVVPGVTAFKPAVGPKIGGLKIGAPPRPGVK